MIQVHGDVDFVALAENTLRQYRDRTLDRVVAEKVASSLNPVVDRLSLIHI